MIQHKHNGYLAKPVPARHKQLKEKYGAEATALKPNDSHKSFYNKAYILDFGRYQKLLSYDTIVLVHDTETGEYYRTWHNHTATTGRHIIAFAGLRKHEYLALPYVQDTFK